MKQEKLKVGAPVPNRDLKPGYMYKYNSLHDTSGEDMYIQFVKSYEAGIGGLSELCFNYMGGALIRSLDSDGFFVLFGIPNEAVLCPILNWRKQYKLDMPKFEVFDKILYLSGHRGWRLGFFEQYVGNSGFIARVVGDQGTGCVCIPFNEHTEHLLGRVGEPPYNLRHPKNRMFI